MSWERTHTQDRHFAWKSLDPNMMPVFHRTHAAPLPFEQHPVLRCWYIPAYMFRELPF